MYLQTLTPLLLLLLCLTYCDGSLIICPRNFTRELLPAGSMPSMGNADGQWSFFQNNGTPSDDGELESNFSYLLLSSFPFTKAPYGNSEAASLKYYLTRNKMYTKKSQVYFYLEAVISGRSYDLQQNPFDAGQVLYPEKDPRLAAGGVFVDCSYEAFRFGIVLTNEKVYAVYYRSPKYRNAYGNYAAFLFAVPLADRSSKSQWHQVAITVDPYAGAAYYYLEGQLAYAIPRVGMLISRNYMLIDWGGEEVQSKISWTQYSFGSMDALDGYSPCAESGPFSGCKLPPAAEEKALLKVSADNEYVQLNPRTGRETATYDRENYWVDSLWGQGTVLYVKSFREVDCIM